MPMAMAFKRYHCIHCGAVLKKERTHRVVTKDDKDYYQYHNYGSFPLRDHDVYDYRFQCPACGKRISFNEQCIMGRIQKKQGHFILSSSEIKDHYQACTEEHKKRVLARGVLIPVVFGLIAFALYCYNQSAAGKDFKAGAIICLIAAAVFAVDAVKEFRGDYRLKFKSSYSYEKKSQLERLHAYSSYNKELVGLADKCYCFYCKESMASGEIVDYADEGQTAICPKCGIDSIIPDSIPEPLDEDIISEMNAYWF